GRSARDHRELPGTRTDPQRADRPAPASDAREPGAVRPPDSARLLRGSLRHGQPGRVSLLTQGALHHGPADPRGRRPSPRHLADGHRTELTRADAQRALRNARSKPGSARTTVSRSTVSEIRMWPGMPKPEPGTVSTPSSASRRTKATSSSIGVRGNT